MKQHNKKIHFIGIGGIGVSALAQWYLKEGWQVQGSDSTASLITNDLEKQRIEVWINDDSSEKITKDINLVVYSPAVPEGHPERKKAAMLEIKQLSYPQALGKLTQQKKTIAVCGTHGKSTTAAMTALILAKAGFDPTVILGTRVPQFNNSNFKHGQSEWLVIEADEYKESFLNYKPFAIVATNVEADHLDYYRNFEHIKNTFKKFFSKLDDDGVLVINHKDPFLSNLELESQPSLHFFNIESSRAAQIKNLLKVPGEHNLANAAAADALAQTLGINEKDRNEALSEFKGTWRRFEYKGRFKGAKVYDDYAHHPTEIKAVLQAAKELYKDKKIWIVHQPHHTSRLQSLFNDFAKSFNDADEIIVLETYKVKGREQEKIDAKLSAKALAEKINKTVPAKYAKTQEQVISMLEKEVKKDDIILITGAGDITEVSSKLTINH